MHLQTIYSDGANDFSAMQSDRTTAFAIFVETALIAVESKVDVAGDDHEIETGAQGKREKNQKDGDIHAEEM
jgi:hypothetical protein